MFKEICKCIFPKYVQRNMSGSLSKCICPKRYMQRCMTKRVCSGECFGGMSKKYFQIGGCMPKRYVQEIKFGMHKGECSKKYVKVYVQIMF